MIESSMNHRLVELSVTYHALVGAIGLLKRLCEEENFQDWEKLVERIDQQAGEVSRELIETKAASTVDLRHKASVVLDWIKTDTPDVAEELAISLCQDVLQMSATTQPSAGLAEVSAGSLKGD